MNTSFLLPTEITTLTDETLIQKVKEHLEKLDYQKAALEFLEIFKHLPNLINFEFDFREASNDEGGTYDVIYISNSECTNPNKINTTEALLYRHLEHIKCLDKGKEFLWEIAQIQITQDNIIQIVENSFIEGEFARWQEAKKAIEEAQQLNEVIKCTNSNKTNTKI